jgi:diguanylate cyclase (GGDEF)-like protein
MDHLIRVLLVSQDRGLRADTQAVCAGRGDPGVERAHRDFADRLQAVGVRATELAREPSSAWRFEYARSIDAATDMLETPSVVNAAAFLVILDCDWEHQENILLFTLTLQAVSESAHLVFVGTKPEGQLRSLVAELGEADRVSFMRKPFSGEELSRVLMNLAWRGIVAHNLRQADVKGFSGVGAAELAGALLVESEAEQRRMAVQDSLTGLGNRRLFDARLAEVFALDASRRSHALLLIDLDKFKSVNDTMGHAAGDELLRQVADRLREQAGPGDIIVRLGGDEFAIIRAQTDGTQDIAEAIVAALCTPFQIEGTQVQIGGSIGWASLQDDAKDAAELCARADTALYAVKAAGRGSARRYTRDQDRQRAAREALEREMRQRIKAGPAPILFSPIAEASSGAIVAAEGILDLTGEGLADITEARLESLLNEPALAMDVALWTVTSTIAQAQRIPSLGISFNLTPRLFRSDQTAERLAEAIAMAQVDPARLVAEIPCTAVFVDPDLAIARIKALRDIGIAVVLDDFGVGPISIDTLVRLDATGAKVASDFTHAAVASAQAAQMMRGLTFLASGASLSLTAAGVDTGAQWLSMSSFRCQHLQGRAISALVNRDGLLARIKEPLVSETGATQEAGWAR